jgi:hypothetical protein
MSKKMKITISFEDKKGRTISKPVEITKNVPWLKEFEELGFEEGFDNLETAIFRRKAKSY